MTDYMRDTVVTGHRSGELVFPVPSHVFPARDFGLPNIVLFSEKTCGMTNLSGAMA
jgi:hypothetical protein